MTIQQTATFTTTDGTVYTTRKEAQDHQDHIDRKARLEASFPGTVHFTLDEVAANAALILAALTLPSRFGRKPKAAAPAATPAA